MLDGCSKNPVVSGSSPGGPTRNENTNLRVSIFLSVTLSNDCWGNNPLFNAKPRVYQHILIPV
jgi:hypothetical protein